MKDGKDVRPIVTNTCNFTRPAGDAPALLSQEEVETLFHELGHGLNSILSKRRYEGYGPMPRDFVELPSQIMENWAFQPEVLSGYARHWKTGETIPPALIEKIQRTARFDQGFKNTEYLAAALLDLEWHTLSATAEPDAAALERIALSRMGMPATILPRYRTTYFQHAFGPAAATRPGTTATSGPRFSTPTPSPPSRRRGSSTRPPPTPSATCSRRGARSTPWSSS